MEPRYCNLTSPPSPLPTYHPKAVTLSHLPVGRENEADHMSKRGCAIKLDRTDLTQPHFITTSSALLALIIFADSLLILLVSARDENSDENRLQLEPGGVNNALDTTRRRNAMQARSLVILNNVEGGRLHTRAGTTMAATNFGPLVIITGALSSSQTALDVYYNTIRTTVINVISAIGVVNECNICYALNTRSREYCTIKFSLKASGYTLAFIVASWSGRQVDLSPVEYLYSLAVSATQLQGAKVLETQVVEGYTSTTGWVDTLVVGELTAERLDATLAVIQVGVTKAHIAFDGCCVEYRRILAKG